MENGIITVQNFDGVIANLILNDEKLSGILKTKIEEAIKTIDLSELMANEINESLISFFEDFDIGEILAEPLQNSLKKIVMQALNSGKTKTKDAKAN
jgi:hypothetical protein